MWPFIAYFMNVPATILKEYSFMGLYNCNFVSIWASKIFTLDCSLLVAS